MGTETKCNRINLSFFLYMRVLMHFLQVFFYYFVRFFCCWKFQLEIVLRQCEILLSRGDFWKILVTFWTKCLTYGNRMICNSFLILHQTLFLFCYVDRAFERRIL